MKKHRVTLHRKKIHSGEDNKNSTAEKWTLQQLPNSSRQSSFVGSEFLWLLVFETVARVLKGSQVNNSVLVSAAPTTIATGRRRR